MTEQCLRTPLSQELDTSSEHSDVASVIPLELATSCDAAVSNVEDPIRSAEATAIGSANAIELLAPAADNDPQIDDAMATAHAARLPQPPPPPNVGTHAVWSPSELFASIANDTFFNFLEAFHLQLSPTADNIISLHPSSMHVSRPCPSSSLPDSSTIQPATATNATLIPMNAYVDAQGKTLLHHACRAGNVQVAKALLFHGIDAFAQCHLGRTACHDAMAATAASATAATTLELLQLLFAHEPQSISVVDVNGAHVVHFAAIHGCRDVIEWYATLLEDDAATACSSRKRLSLAPLSITSFSGCNLLHYAAYNGHLAILQFVVGNKDDKSSDDSDSRQYAWQHAFSVGALDANGYSVLHYAAMGGHVAVCEWLILHSSSDNNLHILAKNRDGQTAFDVAKTPATKHFIAQVAQLPLAPQNVRCIGADASSLGVAWSVAPLVDTRLRQVLAPRWFELEVCKKPNGLSIARSSSSLLSLVLATAQSATTFLLKWEPLSVQIEPTAREHWLANLACDTEYFVRLRAVNRNGASAYSTLRLVDNEFRTTNRVGSSLRRVLTLFPHRLHASPTSPCMDRTMQQPLPPPTFIGTLHVELLEARHLAIPTRGRRASSQFVNGASSSFYCTLTLNLPNTTAATAPTTNRRHSVSLVARPRVHSTVIDRPTSSNRSTTTTRTLCSVRSSSGRLQDAFVLAGSRDATQHPAFDISTAFRVPEAANATLTIAMRYASQDSDVCVGAVTLSLLPFVRGVPAKLQWLSLRSASSKESFDEIAPIYGEVLIRTLFLADGILAAPHPTRSGVCSSSARALLEDRVLATDDVALNDGNSVQQHTGSIALAQRSTPLPTESASSLVGSTDDVANASTQQLLAFDAMGFRVYDPRTPLVHDALAIGIETPQRELPCSYEYYRLLQVCIDARQLQRWTAFHAQTHPISTLCDASSNNTTAAHTAAAAARGACNCDTSMECPYTAAPRSETLQDLAWHGLPATWRPALYMRLSGALQLRATYPCSYYRSLLQRTKRPDARGDGDRTDDDDAFDAAQRQIRVDLERTFAGHACWINTPHGQQALERVLLVYAVHNAALGYCQSMTFIVGRLLCLFAAHRDARDNDSKDKATAPFTASASRDKDAKGADDASIPMDECVFWLLVVFCDQLFPTYYTAGMKGLHVDGHVLEHLLPQRLPKLARHLEHLQTPPHIGLLLVTQWLLPLGCATFPAETSFRLLDVLVVHGARVVFAIALALLQLAQTDVLAVTTDYLQLFRLLKHRDQRLFDASLLLEVVQSEHAAVKHGVDQMRDACRDELLQQCEDSTSSSESEQDSSYDGSSVDASSGGVLETTRNK